MADSGCVTGGTAGTAGTVNLSRMIHPEIFVQIYA